MQIIVARAIAVFGLGIGTFLVGSLPLWLTSQSQQFPLFISSLLCFGAGVLLSTSLVHILPDVKAALPENAELVLCAGFFLLYFIDEIAHIILNKTSTSRPINNETTTRQQSSRFVPNECSPLLHKCDHKEKTGQDCMLSEVCHVEHDEPHGHSMGKVGLLIALSIHSVLEGLVVGIQTSSTKDTDGQLLKPSSTLTTPLTSLSVENDQIPATLAPSNNAFRR